jgi:hypothetical protein
MLRNRHKIWQSLCDSAVAHSRYSRSKRCGSRRQHRSHATVVNPETLEVRTLLAAAIDSDWQRLDPAGSLIFQKDFGGELGAPIDAFADDFESGSLSPAWTTSSSTGNGRIGVSNTLGATVNNGSFHLAMDTLVNGPFNRNEAILTVDLSGASNADLSFAHKDVNDEDHALPPTFVGSINGDGVSISDNGVTWHRLVSLNNSNSPNQVYTDFDFDLGAEAAAAGISLGSNFQIKFQQFDNFRFNTDGRTFDDVVITTPGPLSDSTTAFLEADQTLTVVATPDDPSTTLTATVRDPSNVVLATATATGPGETLDIQTIGIGADGNYTVEITGDSAGDFDLSLYRNATVEVFDTDDGSEQDATGSFIPLGSGRFGIVGSFDGSTSEEEEERSIVWGIQPDTGDILKIDPLTGTILDTFPAPDALTSAHRINGLSIAEEGNTLLYVNGGVNGNNLYRLDPDDGTVLTVESLSGFGGNRGGLSFESEGPDSIFAIDDGGPVDRQAGYGGPLTDWTPSGAGFPGALGGDDNGRLFVYRFGQIQEFSTTVANTQLNALPLPLGVNQLQGLAFDGVNLYASDSLGNLFTLDPDTGATLNQVTVAGGSLSGLGADIVGGGGTLQSGPIYTTQQDGIRLGTIDKATGAGTDIGPFGSTQTWAAAFDTDGSLFTTINGFSGNAVLASVNQTTGAVTTIGSGVGTNMISLEVATDGTMYGIGYNDQILYEINKTTGAATAIGNTGISFNMDLAFDSAGVMYATVGNSIWTVDTATGSSTLLGTYTGIASGSVMGIMFDHTDRLFATAYVTNSPLYEIDVNTLSATVIGNTSFVRPHGGDILITSSGPVSSGSQAIVPAASPDIYGDPGEPGRFPPGPNVPAQAVAPSELLVNGSFETGDFTGWTTVTTGGPFRPWAVTGGGQGGGFGMLQTQPQDGAFVAWNGFDGGGPMEFQMFQDVTIAAGATATLEWMDRVQWNFGFGGPATIPRLYDVEIRDPGTNALLQNVFSFSTGIQATNPTGNTNWQTHSVDVSAFAGQTVRLFFREQIPQSGTGPAQIEFDAVSLTEDAVGTTVETMYGSVGRNSINAGGLLLVDQTTGAGTLLSDPITPGGMPGLVYDSASDVLFGATNRTTGVGTSTLVRLDPDTGALLSTVGTITAGPAGPAFGVSDLAIQPGTGVLYGIRSNSAGLGGRLYTIDKTTAVATLVGNTFQNRGGGLGFAPDGTLYYAEFNQLHTLNPANAAILSTVFISGAAPDGLGIRPSDGTLFSTQAGGGSQLIHTINPATGAATVLGTTGAGGASDLAFRVETVGAGPDVDEYLLDLTGKAGQPIDIAFSTDIDLAGGTGAQFNDSLTETNNVHTPNILNFDFTGAPSPTGDATLDIDAIADLNGTTEFLTLDAEGIFSQQLFVTGGLQQQPISTTVTIPEATLALLAADGTVSFTVTPSNAVNNLGPNSLTLELTYAAASGGSASLELLDTDGTTVLATGMDVSDNFDLGILDFVVPADGIYTVRVTGDAQGQYGIVVTDPLVFDTEANEPNSTPLRSLDAYDGALGFLGDGSTASSDVDLSLMTSFESLSFPTDSGFIPPDPIIAAGPASVITMVNTDIAIHDKITGAIITKSDLDGGGGFWPTNNIVFDPWITYDPDSARFFAIGIDRVSGGGGSSRVYLSVSTDSTPTNLTTDWNKYIINRTGTHTGTGGSTFPDYPKLGVDDDAIYITGNDFGITGGGFSHVSLFAIEKSPILSGGPANILYDEVITGAFSVHPVTNYDPGAPIHFAEAVGSTGIRVHTLNNVLTAPVRTTTTVGVPTFFFPPDVPQQGAPPLDSVSQRIMSGVVRDGSLWTGHAIRDPAVDTETVMRWYEIDVSGAPSLVQSGNVDPGPGLHTWMGSVNVDNDGDMGIVFSISGPSQFAGIGYTGRLATDAPGTTRPAEIARTGDGSYSRFDGIGRNRWGDYSGLAIDPDGESFWLYNEYAAAGNNWGTFVGEFQVEAGAASGPNVDTYEITLAAGEQIGLSTITPFDDPIDGLNLLDPSLEVLDPGGVSVAFDSNSGGDGKNAAIPTFTAAAAGVYKVVVGAEDDGDGEYVLGVNWAPTLDNLALSAGMIFENESVSLTGAYSDQNLDDSHAVVIDWDDPNDPVDSTFAVPAINTLTVGDNFVSTDGAVLEITALDLLTGEVSFEVTDHQYLDDGLAPGNGTPADASTVTVSVTDDGGLTAAPFSQEFIINGDFETGTFAGWNVSGTNSATWQINNGTLDPAGPGTALAPISGNYDAVSTQSGSGLAMLSEPIVVPSVVSSAVLSWSDRIRNHAAIYSDPGQEWRVLVLDSGGSLIQEVFSTDPGDPLTQPGPNNRSFDLTSLFQSLAGQTVQVSFEQQSQFFFMNATLDNVSLQVETAPSVLVKNVAPEISTFTSDATLTNKGQENELVSVSATFTDVGTLDVHTATIDWGDGTTTTGIVSESGGSGTVSGSHPYATGGIFTITVTLTDDDTGVASTTTTAIVTGVGVNNGVLYVIGTSADDHVTVNQQGNGLYKVHADFLPDGNFRTVSSAGVTLIHIVLCAGNDHATIAGNIDTPSVIEGDGGDDHLNGGGGSNIILGGSGDDMLTGGSARDILIGGTGADRLVGNGGDDILIGGWTIYDSIPASNQLANLPALFSIRDRWNTNDAAPDRMADVENDSIDGFFLEMGQTVNNDDDDDVLTGSSGADWFLLFPDDQATDYKSKKDDLLSLFP